MQVFGKNEKRKKWALKVFWWSLVYSTLRCYSSVNDGNLWARARSAPQPQLRFCQRSDMKLNSGVAVPKRSTPCGEDHPCLLNVVRSGMSVAPCVRGRVEMRAVTKGDFSRSMNATFSPVSEGRQRSAARGSCVVRSPLWGGSPPMTVEHCIL